MKNEKEKKNAAPIEEEEKVTAPEKEEASENEAVSAELEKLKKEKDELNDRYLRILAEYDNFRKRTQKEKDEIYGNAASDTVAKLLPILDSFDRAAGYECPDAEYKKGIDLIGNSVKEVFESLGVKEIPALGEQFDPKFHNAVMHNDDPSRGENLVVDVFRKGYMIGDKVIRFSMVSVVN